MVLHLRAIRIKFRERYWLCHQSLKKKLAIVERLFWHLTTCSSGRCVVERFKQELNVWTVRWVKRRRRFISGGSTLLNIFSLYQGKLGNLWRSNTPELLCTMFGYTVWWVSVSLIWFLIVSQCLIGNRCLCRHATLFLTSGEERCVTTQGTASTTHNPAYKLTSAEVNSLNFIQPNARRWAGKNIFRPVCNQEKLSTN